jgi:hypothetical protein
MTTTLRFGKKPADPARQPKLKFAKYAIPAILPVPPAEFGYEEYLPADSGVLGNDAYGDCVLAGADHETMLWAGIGGAKPAFSAATALADYAALTGFNPNDPSTDQGTDMQAAAAYRRKTGVIDRAGKRHQIGGYVGLERGNLDEHKVATFLFAAVGIGLIVSDTQIGQFERGEPWDGALGSNPGPHYVSMISFRGGYLLVVTWGGIQKVSPEFFFSNNDESLAYLSTEAMKDGKSIQGFDLVQLTADLAAVNSQPKGPLAMSTTSPPLVAAELAAAQAAFSAYVTANVLGWEARLLPADKIQGAIIAVVEAIDGVRNAQPAGAAT